MCKKKIRKKKKPQKFKEFNNWKEFMEDKLSKILTKEKTYASWKKDRDKRYKNEIAAKQKSSSFK